MRAQDRLREVVNEANELAAKGVLDKDESAKLEALLHESDSLKAQIDNVSKLSRLNEWAGESTGSPPLVTGGPTIRAITPAGATEVKRSPSRIDMLDQYGEGLWDAKTHEKTGTDEYRNAFKSYMRGKSTMGELKVLQEGADTSGGFLVPADILNRVIAREPTPSRVAGLVTQLQTSRDQLVIPKIVYTADNLYTTGMRVTWTGEIPSSSSVHRVTDPVFGQVTVPIFTAMMSLPITNDMIEDSSFPIISYASGKFGETIDLLRDNMIINGTGLGQPAGILVNPGVGDDQPAVVTSGSSSTLTGNGLIDLAFALPEQYDDNARFLFNKTSTAKAIAQLKDSDGRYMWGAGLQDSGLMAGWKNRDLLGYPVVMSGFMPDIAASAWPIIFGDFSGYYLVNRIGFSVQILKELYAETNQILLLGRVRFGGITAEPWKLRIQQIQP
jgi:HK97 family phage major capsid protein